jgi:hypothetical protein
VDVAIIGGHSSRVEICRLDCARDYSASVKKNELKPWLKEQWWIPEVSAEFVAWMEDVLDLYAEPYDAQRPVVGFDETSKQLIEEKRQPLPSRPSGPARYDYEYQRNGVRNLFMCCEPLAGWRHIAVTQQRTMQDFAHQMKWLVDEQYPEAEVIRVVMDNLNPTNQRRATRPLHPKRRAASSSSWSFTSRRSMAVGSTWLRLS